MPSQLKNLTWIHHASFRLEQDGFVIYLDPWRIRNAEKKADLILITHTHPDHFDLDSIKAISKSSTVVVGPADFEGKLDGVKTMKPGDKLTVGPAEIEAVPSYNIGKLNHPKDKGWLGFLVRLGGETVYHAGDTDLIPEFFGINCSIALIPVGGTYTMDKNEALEALTKIPMHYGAIVGGGGTGKEFKSLAESKGIDKVIALEPEEELEAENW